VIGIHQSPDGNSTAQLTHLTTLENQWATSIKEGVIPRQLAWQGLHTMIWPALHYSLLAMTFSPLEANSIMQQLYACALPKLGAVHTFLLLLHHAPHTTLGSTSPTFIGNKAAQQSMPLWTSPGPQVTTSSTHPWNKDNLNLELEPLSLKQTTPASHTCSLTLGKTCLAICAHLPDYPCL